MEFESSLRVVSSDWSNIQATALERQHPKYTREGNRQIVTTNIDSFYFIQQVEEDEAHSLAKVSVQFTAKKQADSSRLFFSIRIPENDAKNKIAFQNAEQKKSVENNMADLNNSTEMRVSGVTLINTQSRLQLSFDSTITVIVRNEKDDKRSYHELFIPLQQGSLQNGQIGSLSLTIKASGTVDKSPVIFHLNTKDKGRTFTGFGGNFRLQNPKTDPQVIDYCLDNMRVAWGRVEMPFQWWQPVKDSNPIDSAKAGKLHPHVKESMEMAARLAKMNIPVILTAWSAPRWAITGELRWHRLPGDPWGNPLDTSNRQAIYKSIADYITYLRDVYGVDRETVFV